VRPPRNYDALRQAEQQAREARDAASQSDASAQLDSAQKEPSRPTNHPAPPARYTDGGDPVLLAKTEPVKTELDAAEIARAAKERADEAAARAKEQERGKDGR
jgi:hypothetical protein